MPTWLATRPFQRDEMEGEKSQASDQPGIEDVPVFVMVRLPPKPLPQSEVVR